MLGNNENGLQKIVGQRITGIFTFVDGLSIDTEKILSIDTEKINVTIEVDVNEDNPDVFARFDIVPEEYIGSTILAIYEIYDCRDGYYRTHEIETDAGSIYIETRLRC